MAESSWQCWPSSDAEIDIFEAVDKQRLEDEKVNTVYPMDNFFLWVSSWNFVHVYMLHILNRCWLHCPAYFLQLVFGSFMWVKHSFWNWHLQLDWKFVPGTGSLEGVCKVRAWTASVTTTIGRGGRARSYCECVDEQSQQEARKF